MIVKFAEPPLTTGSTAPELTAGPTEAGLLVQVRLPLNSPVTAQAEGVRAAPL